MNLRHELGATALGFAGGWQALVVDDNLMIYDHRSDRLLEVTASFGEFLLYAEPVPDQSVSTVLGLPGRS